MAEGLNRVTLIGNLGQDPELRFTQGGTGVLNLRIATNESYVDREGERKERVEWHTCTIWGKRGEGLNRVLSKGSQICVEGRLQTRSWEDKNGNKRYTTEVVATNVVLLGGGKGRRKDDDDRDDERGGGGGSSAGGGSYGGGSGGFDDEDIPF